MKTAAAPSAAFPPDGYCNDPAPLEELSVVEGLEAAALAAEMVEATAASVLSTPKTWRWGLPNCGLAVAATENRERVKRSATNVE